MKIAPAQAESFCQKPPVNVQAILIYGFNDGLVRTRAESCVGTVLEDTRDPFRFAEFDAQKLRSDPALFHDETSALSLIGGRRVVRVRRATDQVSDLLGTFLEQAVDSVLVVVDAGSLGPRSSLRKLFEGNVNAAAIACYEDSDSEIEQFLRRYCQEKSRMSDATGNKSKRRSTKSSFTPHQIGPMRKYESRSILCGPVSTMLRLQASIPLSMRYCADEMRWWINRSTTYFGRVSHPLEFCGQCRATLGG
jgi:DNA polymerase-3 subunit delta